MLRQMLIALGCVGVAAPAVGAQSNGAAALPRLMPEAEEVALARSAAPAWISDSATVYVLRRGGHVKVREGTNGFNCLVSRDNPESLYPICYNPEASRSVLPVSLKEQQLSEQGKSEADIRREIDADYARGTFKPPTGAAMSYMMSPSQVIYAGPTGRRIGQWHPHVMIYVPYATSAQLGVNPPRGHVFIGEEGAPTAHFVVVVPEWAGR